MADTWPCTGSRWRPSAFPIYRLCGRHLAMHRLPLEAQCFSHLSRVRMADTWPCTGSRWRPSAFPIYRLCGRQLAMHRLPLEAQCFSHLSIVWPTSGHAPAPVGGPVLFPFIDYVADTWPCTGSRWRPSAFPIYRLCAGHHTAVRVSIRRSSREQPRGACLSYCGGVTNRAGKLWDARSNCVVAVRGG